MNIHPIFVHFPIALLIVYTALEILRLKKIKDEPAWLYLKAAFLILGTLGAFAALQTGELGQRLYRDQLQLVGIHENFASLTTIFFSILSVNYLYLLAENFYREKIATLARFNILLAKVLAVRKIIFSPPTIITLALAGFVALFITGTLGGAIVYGPNTDPVVSFVYHLFFK